jgi:hypothetical protein
MHLAGFIIRKEEIGRWRHLHSELHDLYERGPVKKAEVGGACDTYRREEKCMQGFSVETSRKETT